MFLMNTRKKFREARSEDGFYIEIKSSRHGGILQRRDGRYDVYADVPSGQNAFIGTFAGLNGAEAALRHHDKYMEEVFRSGRYNPLRRNPVTVEKKDNRDIFRVNEKKWFTTRERAEAWLAENEGKEAKAPKVATAPKAETKPAAAAKPAAAPKVGAGYVSLNDFHSEYRPLAPVVAHLVSYDGVVYPNVEAAFSAVYKRGATDRKRLKKMAPFDARDLRLTNTKGQFSNRRPKNPAWRKGLPIEDKYIDPQAELLEIVRDLLRNRVLADLLLKTGNKTILYSATQDTDFERKVRNMAVEAKGEGAKARVTDNMLLGGAFNLYAKALMVVRDELKNKTFRRF
jgi:hypothetical protein